MPSTAKKPVPIRPIVAQPSVLIFKEKHGKRYFHVPDDKALFAAALHVLAERKEDGYWYPSPPFGDTPEEPDVKPEDIEKLPKSLQATAKKKLDAYRAAMVEIQDDVLEHAAIEKALADKDGRAAWECLRNRRDAEYEGFDLERYEDLDDD